MISCEKLSYPRNRKLASCTKDEQSKYESEETGSTSDVESCSCHGEPRTGIEVCGQQYHAVTPRANAAYSQAHTQKHRSRLSQREKLEARLLCRNSSSQRRKKRKKRMVEIEKKRKLRVAQIELCFAVLYGLCWL